MIYNNVKKKIAMLAFLFFALNIVIGQNNGSVQNNNSFTATSGKISGDIIDDVTNEPIEYATISVFRKKDSTLLTGAVTDIKGNFKMERVPSGKYYLRISFIGYKTLIKDSVYLEKKNSEKNLGIIRLTSNAKKLGIVNITSTRNEVEYNLDKKVVTVGKDMFSAGGTAVDVMQTIPSVTVNVDGSINLKGSSNITIIVDGKPSMLTSLDQLPASMIEKVEVVTNPSARYDAEGMTGIINIVLKKNNTKGYYGMASFTAGTGNKYNGSVNYNYRLNRFNFFGSYDNRFNNTWGTNITNTANKIKNDSVSYLMQNQYYTNYSSFNNLRIGADYYINDYNTLSFSSTYNIRKNSGESTMSNDFRNYNLQRQKYYNSMTNSDNKGIGRELNLNYKKTYKETQKEFTAEMYYSSSSWSGGTLLSQQPFDISKMTPVEDYIPEQKNSSPSENYYFHAKSDYVHPFENGSRLEAGFKSSIRKNDLNYYIDDYNSSDNEWNENSGLTNHFIYKENINAAYGIYSSRFNNFKYQVGLRAEQSNTISNQVTTDTIYRKSYIDLFPTIHLKYEFNERQGLKLSYSRRINRPNSGNLNPFRSISDPLNVYYGNPDLDPEFYNSYEFAYSMEYDKFSFMPSLFYRQTDNLISRIVTMRNDTSETTYKNLNKGSSYGLEFVYSQTIMKGWKVNTNLSFYKYFIEGQGISSSNYANNKVNWTGKINSSVPITKYFSLQINFNYSSPMYSAISSTAAVNAGQGYTCKKENYSLNLGTRMDFLKNKLSLTVRLNDVFKTSNFDSDIYGDNFISTYARKRETRILYAGLSYKISGGMKEKVVRKEKEEEEEEINN
ncbi:MAG: TonB-dependent receptor [Bacteroidota bacterium]|nr:TonB-dependent receptor [Bacteroidota bacterium]